MTPLTLHANAPHHMGFYLGLSANPQIKGAWIHPDNVVVENNAFVENTPYQYRNEGLLSRDVWIEPGAEPFCPTNTTFLGNTIGVMAPETGLCNHLVDPSNNRIIGR